jgi:hypothetical protein
MMDDREIGFRLLAGAEVMFFLQIIQIASCAKKSSCPVCPRAVSPAVKPVVPTAVHSLLSSTEV